METKLIENVHQEDLDHIVDDLFRTMLATEVTPVAEYLPSDEALITAIIPFAGPWKGDLVLECRRPQARYYAQRFLQIEDLDETSDDIPSTLGELANIVAGNLKVVLPKGVTMGTPSLIEGKDYTVRVCGGKTVCCRSYSTDVGSFLVGVIDGSTLVGEGQ